VEEKYMHAYDGCKNAVKGSFKPEEIKFTYYDQKHKSGITVNDNEHLDIVMSLNFDYDPATEEEFKNFIKKI
jgi:hypothetical protein